MSKYNLHPKKTTFSYIDWSASHNRYFSIPYGEKIYKSNAISCY